MPKQVPAVVEIERASFGYGDQSALSHVSCRIAPGEAMAVIGPNGSGKSTLLKGIVGILHANEGSMLFSVPTEAQIGYLPQTEHIDPDFPVTLKQVVMMGRYRSHKWWQLRSRADRQAVREALAETKLTELASKRFGTLSGGQQQRGFLARALAVRPQLLLLDEPFNGLDQPNRDSLLDTIRALKKRGVAVVITTHDLDLAREVCDTVLLVNGEQVAFGPREEVLTLENLQKAFHEVQVELDEHTLVVPGHEGH